MFENELKACVIGEGIKHSRSPLIHNHWIKEYGLNAIYLIQDCSESELPSIMQAIRNGKLLGCNVTVPHKQAVIPYLDELDLAAKTTGSVNTVYMKDGKLRGTSTDGAGYLAHLKSSYPDFDSQSAKVLILGAGGASRSIAAAFANDGCKEVMIANRTYEKAQDLCNSLSGNLLAVEWAALSSAMPRADIIINTTVLGQTGKPPLNISLDNLPATCIVSDIVYVPLETELLKQARLSGRPTLDGLGMLLHQAAPAFELWFNKQPQVTTELRTLVEQDLQANG